MTSMAEDLAGVLAVETSRRGSNAVTLCAAIARGEGSPLNEIQLNAVIQAVISCFDGLEAAFEHHLSIDADLRTGKSLTEILGGIE